MLGDKLVAIVAPFDCLGCGREGSIICKNCLESTRRNKRPTCYLCNRLVDDWRTCQACRSKTKISGVVVAADYDGLVKELIKRLKYGRTVAAAEVLAGLVAAKINPKQLDLITAVPASTKRQRQRGYNPAELIGRSLARQLGLPHTLSLAKLGHLRQVGTSRQARLKQIKGTIYPLASRAVRDRRVLVVDDVVTTGATMTECARVLKSAGAKAVWGAAVAKH